MAVRELHCLAAQRKPQELVTEADSEDRHSPVGELAQGANRVCHCCRVARAVREEDAVRLELADAVRWGLRRDHGDAAPVDRKSTRLNSSHLVISYAVFCLK